MARPWLLDVTLALVAVAATLSSAQQTVPAFPMTLPSCPPAPLSLSPCIGYVFGVGSASLTSCCSQLRSFLQAQAPCICAASRLAPSPIGLILGQAQAMIPNVCDLPNPCDGDAAGEGTVPEASAPSVAAPLPATATTPATGPSSSSTPAADPDTAGAPPAAPAEDPPATETAPAGTGSKLPQLLHAAGATTSRGAAAGTVFVAVFLASVATMYA